MLWDAVTKPEEEMDTSNTCCCVGRSLSNSSSLYMKYNTQHDGPYWRGAIWMNINYLTLQVLLPSLCWCHAQLPFAALHKCTVPLRPECRPRCKREATLILDCGVQALHHYASLEGPHQAAAAEASTELRKALLSNVVRVHEATGFPWENYSDGDGAGKGSHPFSGWTALLVLIAAEMYG